MNILIITFEFPPMGGGAGSYCMNLAMALSKMDYNVTILTTSIKNNKTKENILSDKYKNLNIIRSTLYYKLWPFWGSFFIKNYLQKNTYDIVLYGNYFAFLSALRIKTNYYKHAKIFYTLHGNDIDYLFLRPKLREKLLLSNKSLETMFSRLDKIICVSDYLGRQALQYKIEKKKLKIVHHGIDINIFTPATEESKKIQRKLFLEFHSKPKTQQIILTVARLEKGKGHETLIESVKILKANYPNLLLIIAGEGEERTRLMENVNSLNLNSSVIFTGNLAQKDLIKLYQITDVFVMLSKNEAFGLVYIEAMACGVPVVAGNNGAVQEIITDYKDGLIVDPENEKECADSVQLLFEDTTLRKKIIENGIKTVRNRFSSEIMAKKTIE